ncbi:MAG: redoxin domain-containing protein [Candidatus Omnitrophica bacterium]|nr:redoxin domain-containing protein [Candidatus Omnitrophota bacterium]MDD5592748.1 redoxin domain-containing protein [Candidatus Omnitrophota bacterium]
MSFRMRPVFIVLLLLVVSSPQLFSSSNNTLIGDPAPDFKVVSADKKTLTRSDIKGKIVVLFYEARGAVEENRKLKDELNIFYAAQAESVKKDIVRVAVINCHGVLFKGAWEKGLRESSAKEGITVYGDWDGSMSIAYRAKKDESNSIIIDKRGVVRYYASGEIKDIGRVKELLQVLLHENIDK